MAAQAIRKRPRFILVSDLDWTMVDHNDKQNAALNEFNQRWTSTFAKDSLLVYSTGRSHALYTKLRGEVPLGNPDVLVCSVGTEIFFESTRVDPVPDVKWQQELDQGWDRQHIVDVVATYKGLQLQEESEQRPHKISYHVSISRSEAEPLLQQIEAKLKEQQLAAKLIYSGGEDLDILPPGASKGKGLEFLLKEVEALVGLPTDGVLVCGDSGNDIELFAVPEVRGCMVVNAHPELQQWCDKHKSDKLFQASRRCAGGILEALAHFHLLQ